MKTAVVCLQERSVGLDQQVTWINAADALHGSFGFSCKLPPSIAHADASLVTAEIVLRGKGESVEGMKSFPFLSFCLQSWFGPLVEILQRAE